MTNGQILFINFGAKNINNILKTETCVERKKLFINSSQVTLLGLSTTL